MIDELDPDHPTMTALAGFDAEGAALDWRREVMEESRRIRRAATRDGSLQGHLIPSLGIELYRELGEP